MSGDHLGELDRVGYTRFDMVVDDRTVRSVRERLDALVERARATPAMRDRVTGGTLHLTELDRDPDLPRVWELPPLVAAVRHHLRGEARVSDAAYRAPLPGYGAQTLHVDTPGFAAPGEWTVCNVLVLLVDVADRDGATRVVPGSHLEPDRRFRAKGPDDTHPGEARLTGPAGSAFVFSGHLLHAGSRNDGVQPRHALLVNYRR